MLHTQIIVCATVYGQCLEYLGCITLTKESNFLGGLISHGAVVAREYGLPCVVGAEGATSAFQSGDIVIIDGGKGIISKCNQIVDCVGLNEADS